MWALLFHPDDRPVRMAVPVEGIPRPVSADQAEPLVRLLAMLLEEHAAGDTVALGRVRPGSVAVV